MNVLATNLGSSYLQQLDELRRQQDEGSSDALRALPVSAFAREEDSVSISDAAKKAREAEEERERDEPAADEELSEGEEQMVRELEARDREIRAHENAHKAAAGGLAVGGPTYTYQTGPDGKRYAIGGEVKIRLRSGRTPEETVRNMERAQRAANAPQSPSGPDRAVAAKAASLAQAARADLQAEKRGSVDVLA